MKNKKVKINFFIPQILPNSKRGLSTVVTSLILILLVLVAVGIIWIVIMKIISSGTEQVSLGKLTMNLEIKKVEVHDAGIDVQVKRNTGAGELSGIKFIVSDGVDTQIFEMPTTMQELATKRFTLAYTGLVKKVSIAGIFETSSGKEFTGNEIDEFEFSNKEIIKNLGGISWWRFENNALDEIGGNDGTLVNMEDADWVDGVVGKCLSFDGADEYVYLGNNLEWPGALTVSTWHQRTTKDTESADGIVGNWYWTSDANLRRGWCQRYYSNSDSVGLVIELTDGSNIEEKQVSYTTTVGVWYHVVAVFDPTDRSVKFYVNGVLRDSTTGSAGFDQIAYDSPNPMRIGYNPVNTGYFPGLIDEVQIFNKALSEKQVNALYELDLS